MCSFTIILNKEAADEQFPTYQIGKNEVIIKIINNMQKSGLKQPIYLTKLKRKCKLIDQPLQRHEVPKENVIHDIQFLQKSLEVQKRRGSEQLNTKLNEMALPSWNNNRAESISTTLTNLNGKASYRLFDGPTTGSFLQDITQNISNQTLLNHSKAYPQTDSKQEFLQREKKILDQPKLACLKARAKTAINVCKENSQQEFKSSEQSNIDKSTQRDCQQSISEINILKEKYEIQIMELEQKNKVLEDKVHKLQDKLMEKQAMQLRVSQIQKDLRDLLQQNQELYRINEELSNSQIKCQNIEVSIQTQSFPLYVQDSYCQTYTPESEPHQFKNQFQILDDFPSQDWFNRAKMWKIQLQREKVMAINRQAEFRSSLDNIKIQHRQEMNMIQNRLSVIIVKYDSKCQQIKQKQGIINKYVLQKAQ